MLVVVGTVKDTLANVERFVRRNLAGGMDHVLVFLDDDQPDVEAFLRAHPHATPVRTDDTWWHGQRPERLNARQWVNAELAGRHLAGLADWVFHVDGDEVAHVDRAALGALPASVRAVRLVAREAVSRMHWDGEPTWFKTPLDADRLELLAALGVIGEPRQAAYFRGHVQGKVGIRPDPTVRLAIHVAEDAEGNRLELTTDPSFFVLHFESPDGEEFVRKWVALLGSGGLVYQRSRRASIAKAMATLQAQGLEEAQQRRFLERLYQRMAADDFETLRDLRLLEQHDPDTWTHEPASPASPDAWDTTVAAMRALPKVPPTGDLPQIADRRPAKPRRGGGGGGGAGRRRGRPPG